MNEEKVELIRKLVKAWIQTPHLRFGQLLVNVVNPSTPAPEIFYVEDAKLTQALVKWSDDHDK